MLIHFILLKSNSRSSMWFGIGIVNLYARLKLGIFHGYGRASILLGLSAVNDLNRLISTYSFVADSFLFF